MGFSGALLLTSTQPISKEPADAFAKRDQPVAVAAPIRAPETTGQAPIRSGSFDILPAKPTKVEEVVGLQFAPVQPEAAKAAAPRTIAPDATPTRAAATPAPEGMTPKVKTPANKPARVKPASDGIKTEPRMKKEYRNPTAIAEKKEPVRKQYAERRKKQIEMADEDEPIGRSAFASERPSRGEGFFSFLFGN